MDHINKNETLLRNYVLKLHLVDGRCKEDTVMQRFLDVYTNKKHKTYVGVLGNIYYKLMTIIYIKGLFLWNGYTITI